MKKSVTSLFNKFAGREVPMAETKRTMQFLGETISYDEVSLIDPRDPTIEEMQKVANDNGLKLRVFWPGIGGTDDYRTDRVNAHIEKGTDGKYRVSNKFNLG